MNQETSCFTGIVAVNGVPSFRVSNDGHGGCHRYQPLAGMRHVLDAAEAYAKTMPNRMVEEPGFPDGIPVDLDWLIDDAFALFINSRDLRRSMSTRVLFTVDATHSDIWGRGFADIPAVTYARVKRDYPQARILNLMPFEEALALFLAAPQPSEV